MRWLKTLSAIYVAAASSYTVAIVLTHHPVLAADLVASARSAAHEGSDAVVVLDQQLLEPGWFLLARQAGKAAAEISMTLQPQLASIGQRTGPRIARAVPPSGIASRKPAVHSAPPRLRPQITPRRVASAAPPALPPVPPEAAAPPSTAEVRLASARLKDVLTRDLFANFDLFLYVSKADQGPIAQHMYVFAKGNDGQLKLRYDWPVSTGREVDRLNPNGKRLATRTPPGYYELDPHRMYVHYTSHEWGEPMPHAMFFNWIHDGEMTGLAIHSAYGEQEVAALGSRASAGCVRLSPDNARTLYELVRSHYAGLEARFSYDRRTATMSNAGELARKPDGSLDFEQGYRVLVVIEDFGGKPVVAIM